MANTDYKPNPPPGTYWVTQDVLAGPYPGTRPTFADLERAGVTQRIDLTQGPYEIRDFEVPPIALMEEILQAIQYATSDEAGSRVYVHCEGGRGRTGTVAGCLLSELGETDPLACLTALRQECGLVESSPETSGQRQMISDWGSRTGTAPLDKLDGLVAACLIAAIDAQPQRVTRAGNPSDWPDERSWGREVAHQLDSREGIDCVVARDVEALAVPVGDWDPAPGKVDLHPRRFRGAPGSLFVAELKLDNINESLWDAFKLMWVAERLSTGPQYVAVAAHGRLWDRPTNGTALFPDHVGSREIQLSHALIAGCHKKWCSQWSRDTAKPRRVPNKIAVTGVVTGHRPAHYPVLELRVARIAAVGAVKLDLAGGTPHGMQSCVV